MVRGHLPAMGKQIYLSSRIHILACHENGAFPIDLKVTCGLERGLNLIIELPVSQRIYNQLEFYVIW